MKNNLIRYSNCWEDTDNLLNTLDKHKNILSICSGGDNTLALLLKNPNKIVAFDLNINQIYLLKLKICAINNLSYEEVLTLLGIYKGNSYELFLRLKDNLELDVFNFFNNNKHFFKKGIIHIGKFERYFQLFRKFICPLFANKKKIKRFVSMKNLEEQKKYYDKYINNKRLNFIFKIFFGFKVMGKYGRDKSFYDYVPEKESSALDIKNRFDNGVKTIENFSNPYINYILLNEFNSNCLPTYLMPNNYKKIKKQVDKIEFVHSSLLGIDEKFDYFNLSDIFEYMSEEDFLKNIDKINAISNKNSKIVYYNMQNKRYINDKKYHFLKSISKKNLSKIKSYFYRDFLVYQKRY